ncbi:MAG: hypothetical protein V3W31_08920 [Thermodesulfobacteriota bacterium]
MRSNAHNKLQDIIKERYQAAGWIAIKEHYINGKKIDVLAQNIETKYTIANEVQLALKHYKENILLDLEVGCDEVRIISISKKVSEQIENKALRELDEELLKKVRFLTIEEFIPNSDNNK